MKNGNKCLSCIFATIASVCFVGGIAILSGGRVEKHGKTRAHHNHVR